MEMFPDSPYIHVGGDETNLSQWKSSTVVQDIKARQGFTDEYQVLKWFIDRIGSHVESRGKKIICWDDMIEKGQYPNATIMSWKGSEIGKLAALANREVIISPYERLYFDHPQSAATEEARSFGPVVTLKSVFNFSVMPPQPTPEERRNIIGGEGCVWTEFIETPDRAEYMAFPRLIALADGLWSASSGKDFRGFITNRLFNEFARLDRLPEERKLNYRIPEPFDLADHVVTRDAPAAIELFLPIPDSRVYFTTDGSVPNTNSSGYVGRFIPVPPGFEGTIKAIVKQTNGRPSSVFEVSYSRGATSIPRIMPPPLSTAPRPRSVNNDVEVVSRAEPIPRPSQSPVAKPVNGNKEKKPPSNNQQ
jgi:hexosaminidase